MKKLKNGDHVIMLAGKDKGKTGKILNILKNNTVLIENIFVLKKHIKDNPQKNIEGGIINKSQPVHISNVAIYNASTSAADKVIFILQDGRWHRKFKSTQELIASNSN